MPGLCFKVDPEYAQISELVPKLFICGVSALSPENMSKYHITHIINATSEVPNVKSLGDIQRSKLWLDDTAQTYIYPHLELQSDQIHAIICDGGNVLVHCVAGVSRSASICLAYLTKYICRSLRDAYHLMCLKRPLVRPNIGFWRQLITYEQEVKKCSPSVRIISDDCQEEKQLPDVYLRQVIPDHNKKEDESTGWCSMSRRRMSSTSKPHFVPVLEPLPELLDAAA